MDEPVSTNTEESPKEIDVFTLTTYEVAPDGSGIRMNVLDTDGKPARIVLPIDCLRALALTMPKMVSDAVSGGYGDPSVRVAHQVESWFLERAEQSDAVLLTLETADRLQISFAIAESALVALADAVSAYEVEAFSPELRCH